MDTHEIISSLENLELNPWEFIVSPFNECYTGEIESVEFSPEFCPYNVEINSEGSSEYVADNEGDEFSEEEDENNAPTVATYVVYVKEQEVMAVVDNSSTVNVITTPLLDQLNYQFDEVVSDISIITLGDISIKPIGMITNLPIYRRDMLILAQVYVLNSTDPILILGNNWLQEIKPLLDKKRERIIAKYADRLMIRKPPSFTRKPIVEEEVDHRECYFSVIEPLSPMVENFILEPPKPPDHIVNKPEISNIQYFNCKCNGHIARNCPNRRSNQERNNTIPSNYMDYNINYKMDDEYDDIIKWNCHRKIFNTHEKNYVGRYHVHNRYDY
jgi:hypothetical protein